MRVMRVCGTFLFLGWIMAQVDGAIRIVTKITTKDAEESLASLERQIKKSAKYMDELRSKMDALKDQKIPTKDYKDLQENLAAAEKELSGLISEQNKWEELGISSGGAWDRLNEKVASASDKVELIKSKMQALTDAGKDFVFGKDTEQYAAYERQLQYEEEAVKKAGEHYQQLLKQTPEMQKQSAEEQRLADIKANATVSNQHILDLLERRKQLTTEIKNMESAGINLGFQEYENAVKELSQINNEIKDYQKNLSELPNKFSNMANSAQKAFGAASVKDNRGKDLLSIFSKKTASELSGEGESAKKTAQEMSGLEKSKSKTTTANRMLGKESDSTAKKISNEGSKAKILQLTFGNLKKVMSSIFSPAKKAFEAISGGANKSGGILSTFTSRLKGIALSLLIFNWISKGFNAMISGMKKGFENFMGYSDSYAQSVQNMKNAMSTLGNQFAAAFSPIVQMVIPWITELINAISNAISYVSQFFAVLGGKNTFTKAIQIQDKYNKSLGGTAAAAKKAAGVLASFDTIEVLNKKNDGAAGAGGGAGVESPSEMFEEVPVDQKVVKWLDNIKNQMKPILDYLDKLKGIFMEGFWDGLGDWEYRWDSIKQSIASIKKSLVDIFTDPAVVSAADGYLQSLAYMFGSLAGSMASIGLTIATNLLGGIAKYLEQNKGRIKEYLISMFDIWKEVNYMFADLFQSIAYVFEAFASEQGQQLTANIIGIFTDAFMGITELASKFFRDLAQLIIKPFVDNKEGFRTALEGFLSVLAEVTGTIKQGIDDTFDKLNEVYDEHFKPFFDSVAQGLSDLTGEFLEFWNGNVQPVLEQWASDFDALWTGHIQPLLDNVAEFLGKIADLLKAIWGNILQPFISWWISNVLPAVLPVIQTIHDLFDGLAATVTDVADSITTILGGVIDFLTGVFSGDWEKAFDGLKEIGQGFVDGFTSIIENIKETFEKIKDRFVEVWDSVNESTANKWEEIKTSISEKVNEIIESIVQWFSELPEKIGYAIGFIAGKLIEWKDNVKTFFDTELPLIIESVVTWFKELPQKIYDAIIGFLDKIREWKESAVSAFQTYIPLIVNEIVTKFQELPGKLIEIGKNAIEGLWNGVKEAANGLKEKISGFCTGFVNGFKDALGVHSPSTLFAEIGGFLIEGLANGVSSAMDLVTGIVGGVVDKILGMFNFDKFSEAGQGMVDSIISVIGTFRETWDESFSEWMESNQELYFGYDVWYEQFSNILTAYTDMFTEFSAQWQSDIGMWWTTMVMPFFELAKWQAFGTQMKTGIVNGLKVIINEIGGLLNKIISMFDSAFKQLEESMNDLIDSYNSSAGTLGTSRLSHVHYSKMGGVKIPALASGAVIRGGNPFMAILGDQPRGQVNVETPARLIKDMVAQGIAESGIGNTGSGIVPVNINLNYNGETFARLSIPDILGELNRQGYDITALMGNG